MGTQDHGGFSIVNELLNMTLLGTEWILWLLIVLSVVSVAIGIERLWYFTRQKGLDKETIEAIYRAAKARDFKTIAEICNKHPSSLEASITLEGIDHRDNGLASMQEAMHAFLLRKRKYLDRGLVVLSTLGNNAPFIGLFGTVLG
ncbi:MAG: hypothetical protein EOP10_08170, partial [Proteobacteria bacterium]